MKKGATLLELVISVALLVVIILATMSVLNYGENIFITVTGNEDLQTEAYRIQTYFLSKVHESKTAAIPEEHPNQLELTDGNDYTTQFFLNKDLKDIYYIEEETGETAILSSKVSNVVYEKIDKGVQLYIELVSGNMNYKFKTVAFGRF